MVRASLRTCSSVGLVARDRLSQSPASSSSPAPLATLASLPSPASSTCQGPPSLSSTSSCQGREKSTSLSKAALDSTSAALMRFFTCVDCLTEKASCDLRRLAPSRPSSSLGTGSSDCGMPAAAAAITSASLASFLATPGKSSRALFSLLPAM